MFHREDSRLERIEGVCRDDNCLPGSSAVDGWAHTFTVLGAIALLITVLVFIGHVVGQPPKDKDGKPTGPSPHRTRAWWAVPLALVGIGAGLLPAGAWASSLPGKAHTLAWSLPYENTGPKNGGSGYGSRSVWTFPAGGNLVRATPDTITSHSLADGRRTWSVPAPVRRTICGTDTRTAGDVALVGYARFDAPCAELTALDLVTGRTRWQQKLQYDTYDSSATYGTFALAGRTAVAAETERLRAFDAATGKRAWTRKLAKGCRTVTLDASADRIHAVEECRKGHGTEAVTSRLLTLDAATGKQLWRSALPVESRALTAYFTSVAPLVLRIKEMDERGVDAFLAYDDQGRARATLPVSRQATGNGNANANAIIGMPEQARVVGDRLITGVITPGDTSVRWVGAFSLGNGERQWLKRLPDTAKGLLTGADGRLTVLMNTSYTTHLVSYDLRNGRRTAPPLAVLGSNVPDPSAMTLYQGPGNTVVVANEDDAAGTYRSSSDVPDSPLFAIR
ncbi:PQQ-like beta-propeller repeat protein [Streptomyces sp. NBC_00237]|uniref:outer membrane protein assembly factor BamB family protein n=1 Tax=Streptomyces sp. NBC_00237 TaxID=2975687 RepID=UPI00225932E7|nr:PQQ-binding-like beta-propeller repeat protein [Streptomyces sp. NBC_00237]MCX5201400.1 PQQ-like beta-propeller repeat protein [Streptomyces sp. NBC_00237]